MSFFPPARWLCRGFLVGVEGPESAASPTGYEVGSLFTLAFILLEPRGEIEEGAEEGGAIIVHELDEAGLPHQAAELDEVAGARSPVLNPLAGVGAGTGEIEPVTPHGQAPALHCRCLECRQ